MAASMRALAASLVPQIHLKLLSPASPTAICLTRCIHQKSVQRVFPSVSGALTHSTPTRGVHSVSCCKPYSLQHRPCNRDELTTTLCSRLTSLCLETKSTGPDGGTSQRQLRSFSSLVFSRFRGEILNKEVVTNQKDVASSVLLNQPRRTVILYSRNSGKRKSVKAVIDRFYRLENGLWVRTQSGRAKKLWKKNSRRRYRLKQHVFCNKTQCNMLDLMVSGYWKKRRYYLDDPFEQYHQRHFDVLPPGSVPPKEKW